MNFMWLSVPLFSVVGYLTYTNLTTRVDLVLIIATMASVAWIGGCLIHLYFSERKK